MAADVAILSKVWYKRGVRAADFAGKINKNENLFSRRLQLFLEYGIIYKVYWGIAKR